VQDGIQTTLTFLQVAPTQVHQLGERRRRAEGALDERQHVRRNRAVVLAFRSLAGSLSIAPLLSRIATTVTQWSWLPISLIVFATWSVFLLSMTLPTAILAWTESDPIAADLTA